MSPQPGTTQPRVSSERTELSATVAFLLNDKSELSVDLGTTDFRDYKLYAASANPDPRSNTDPLDEELRRPPSGRLIGDGTYTVNESYTVQVTYTETDEQVRVLTGQVPAQDVVPNTQVYIVLT